MSKLFNNLPHELRVLKQWVLWKYEDVGAAKPTKVPYQPSGKLANVTDPSTWATFEDCFNAYSLGGYSGIGFVFSDADPYSFIDLDDAEGDDAILQRHLKVYHEFNSYSEVSPSGKGLHIIVKGVVPAGRRRSKIEIYSSARYATMTGNVYNNQNVIKDCQELLTLLWEQMGSGPVAQSMYQGTDKEIDSDDVIIKRASEAVNGDKFTKLLKGEWQDLYQSQSEADFAFIDMLAFYTQNRAQITRLFRNSPLGFRDKAKRSDYVSGMISRSFDRMLPPLDFDGLKNQLELKLAGGNVNGLSNTHSFSSNSSNSNSNQIINGSVAQRLEPSAHNGLVAGSSPATTTNTAGSINGKSAPFEGVNVGSNPAPATNPPPGLLGDIASFIYQAAPRPVPEVALAAAIGLMAGITGRAYNVSGTGLNQYVLLIAMTGAGKEAAAEGIDKLMATIKMQVPTSSNFIGPGEIPSGTGLLKHIANQSQSFVSLLGEFGLKLQQISSPNASSSEVSLRRLILDLYNKSGYGRSMPASAYAKKEDSTTAIPSPAFSILGESTPERFYGALNEDMISEGLLPRFLLIEYKGNRPPLNEQHTSVVPSFSLIEKLAALAAQCETVNHSNPRRVVNVGYTSEAAKMLSDFDKYADSRINSSNKEVIRQLWNRAHIKVLKLSALLAVGQNMIEPTIQPSDMEWSANLVMSDIKAMTDRFEAGEIGVVSSYEIKQGQEIVRVIKEYVKSEYSKVEKYLQNKSERMHNDKIIPYVYLNKRLAAASVFRLDKAGATFAMKRAIQTLVDSDRLAELGKVWCNEKYGTSQRCFVVKDLSLLDD